MTSASAFSDDGAVPIEVGGRCRPRRGPLAFRQAHPRRGRRRYPRLRLVPARRVDASPQQPGGGPREGGGRLRRHHLQRARDAHRQHRGVRDSNRLADQGDARPLRAAPRLRPSARCPTAFGRPTSASGRERNLPQGRRRHVRPRRHHGDPPRRYPRAPRRRRGAHRRSTRQIPFGSASEPARIRRPRTNLPPTPFTTPPPPPRRRTPAWYSGFPWKRSRRGTHAAPVPRVILAAALALRRRPGRAPAPFCRRRPPKVDAIVASLATGPGGLVPSGAAPEDVAGRSGGPPFSPGAAVEFQPARGCRASRGGRLGRRVRRRARRAVITAEARDVDVRPRGARARRGDARGVGDVSALSRAVSPCAWPSRANPTETLRLPRKDDGGKPPGSYARSRTHWSISSRNTRGIRVREESASARGRGEEARDSFGAAPPVPRVSVASFWVFSYRGARETSELQLARRGATRCVFPSQCYVY